MLTHMKRMGGDEMEVPLSPLDDLRQEREKVHTMLLSSVSHDLKTPLASVIGSLEIHQRLKHTLSDERRDALIATALAEAQRLDSFITNILDMARLENGVRFNRQRTDLGQLIRQCIRQNGLRMRQHDIRFEPPACAVDAEVDASWICRALLLLLDNAAKYTPDHTPITIQLTAESDSCILAVRDYGSGIPEDMKTEIFHKYTRITKQDATVAGTGLGLPICKAVAEGHCGSIRIDNMTDGGAMFSLTLPLSV